VKDAHLNIKNSRSIDNHGAPAFIKQQRMRWAAPTKKVQEVDPLLCPACGSTLKRISFKEKCRPLVIEKILRHCGWKLYRIRRLRNVEVYNDEARFCYQEERFLKFHL